METFLKQSASDFLTCGLSNESRTREPARRSSYIDLIDERFVEGNVDPYDLTGVSKEWNSEQDGPRFERCFYILVTQDIVHGTCRLQSPTRTFKCFRMLTQSDGRVPNGLFQSLALGHRARQLFDKGNVAAFFRRLEEHGVTVLAYSQVHLHGVECLLVP